MDKIFNFLLPRRKISVEHDFQAILVCKYIETKWFFILKKIIGSKKIELLGSDINEIDLNMLLPDYFIPIHNKFLIDILTYGNKSEYWNKFVNGKMNRIIEIINPITKQIFCVKQTIILTTISTIFDFTMTDITMTNNIINKTGLLTHDLRSILKSTLNTLNEINITDNNKDQIYIIDELLKEGLSLCSNARTAFLPNNIALNSKNDIDQIKKIYIAIPQFISKLKLIYPFIKIIYSNKSLCCLSQIKLNSLWHIILNTIKNSVNAKATEIYINIYEEKNANIKLIIEIIDNGIGMDINMVNKFFLRELPRENIINDVETNRGEGFILSYNEWKLNGGTCEIKESIINKGTTFFFTVNNTISESSKLSLNHNHIYYLSSLINTNKNIILIVDDILLKLFV